MYEYLKKRFEYENKDYEVFSTASIGALTTFVHDFFIAPTDVIKQRL